MSIAAAIIWATALICATLLLAIVLMFGMARKLIKEVLDQVKMAGRNVSVNVDKKINILVGENTP